MKLWRSMMKLPQPIKGCVVVYLIFFAAAFVSVPLTAFSGREQPGSLVPWTFGALGLAAALLGLMLAFDVRGSARAYAAMTKDYRPMGVDYSKSLFSKPLFIRFFGGMFVLIGVGFVVGAFSFASQAS